MDALVVESRGPLSEQERREIRLAYLTAEKPNVLALAKKHGRNRETIYKLLRGEEFEALKKEVHGEAITKARDLLKQNAVKATRLWTDTAIAKAAKKGDHRAMQDLLKAAGVIEEDQTPRIVVQVGVKLTGGPE